MPILKMKEMKTIQIFPLPPKGTAQARTKEQNPMKNGSYKIGTEFHWIVKTLSIFGNCPLSYDERLRVYKFKWCSLRTFFTFLMASVSFFTLVCFVSEISLETPILGLSLEKPVKEIEEKIMESSTINLTVKLLLIRIIKLVWTALLVPLTWNSIFGWVNCSSLAQFLNRWTDFEQDFWKCFPFDPDSLTRKEKDGIQKAGNFNGFEKERNFFFFKMKPSNFVAMAMLSFCVILILTYSIVGPFPLLNMVFFGYLAIRLFVVEVVEDVKTVFMYKNVMEAFARISTGIAYTTRWQQSLNSEQVKSWRALIHFVRGQCDLVGKHQQPTQLNLLFWTIFSMTWFAFVLFNMPKEDPILRDFCISWNFLAGLYILRLFVKVLMAEQVTKMEAQISIELLKIDMNNLKPATLVQVKFTHDLMAQNPSEISFGNYVVLDRGIFLKIFSQVVTYLIVLMQFIQNS